MVRKADAPPPADADPRGVLRWVPRLVLVLAAAALAAAAVAPFGASAPARSRVTLTTLESGVLKDLNAIRVQHGLVPLHLNAQLSAAATQHSREMGADGYFEHTSHDGTAFWKRIAHWYGSTSYGYWSVGENLLWSSPDVTPSGALQLWMNSPEHRANILAPRWREIGVAALHLTSAPGTYDNLPLTIVTTDFGVRR
jgi:uncharacterized protein YkwD